MINSDNVEALAWETVQKHYKQRGSPYHTPTFCYSAAEGVAAVTIVLRQVSDGQLWFHTDARSRKVTALQQQPLASLHFYNAEDKLQLIFNVLCQVHQKNTVARERWQVSTPLAQACYQFDAAPSQPYHEPQPLTTDGFENFAVVVCQAISVEVLWLSIEANRRFHIDCQAQTVQRLNP